MVALPLEHLPLYLGCFSLDIQLWFPVKAFSRLSSAGTAVEETKKPILESRSKSKKNHGYAEGVSHSHYLNKRGHKSIKR